VPGIIQKSPIRIGFWPKSESFFRKNRDDKNFLSKKLLGKKARKTGDFS